MFARRVFLVGRTNARFFHSTSGVWGKVVHTFKLADIGEGITECEVIKWSVASSRPIPKS